jgi:integrase
VASFDALDSSMAAFYTLRLLTAERDGEVATMRWRDVDLNAGWWTNRQDAGVTRI